MEGVIIIAVLVAGIFLIIRVTSHNEENTLKKKPELKSQDGEKNATQTYYEPPYLKQYRNNYTTNMQSEQNSTNMNNTIESIQRGFQELSDKYPQERPQKGNRKRKSNW